MLTQELTENDVLSAISDAHSPSGLDGALVRFETIIDALQLEESDKFLPFG